MGDSGTESPNKRLKTDNSIHWSDKGKVKVEHESNCCGICFSEAAAEDVHNSVSRGCIDSCNHYFCFICIMEWAKVESKCPLCKRRFSTIRRPAKPPIFPSERLINVPVRNQVYDCFGNAITGTSDPYSETNCSVCRTSDDESLLLLCDLCDSASHTYCVGLGVTVPEGDWFCHECTLVRDEHNKAEIDSDSEGNKSSCNLNESPSEEEEPVSILDIFSNPRVESPSEEEEPLPVLDIVSNPRVENPSEEEEHVSIFDIVSSPRGGTHESLDRISGQSLSRVFVNGARNNNDACLEDDLNVSDSRRQALPDPTVSNSRRQEHAINNRTKLTARTLSQCRNVNDRIRALRDNWNSIRNGSLSFDNGRKPDCVNSGQSNSVSSSICNVRIVSSSPIESGKTSRTGSTSGNGHPSRSSSSIQNREISIGCRGTSTNAGSYDVSKAWRMLDIAKKVVKKSPPYSKNGVQLHLSEARRIQGRENLATVRNGNKGQSMWEPKLEGGRISSGSVNLPSRASCCLVSSDNVFLSPQHESQNRRGRCINEKISTDSIHTAPSYCDKSTSMNEAATRDLNLFRVRRETQSQQSSQQGPSVTKGEEEKPSASSNVLRNCDPKSEIQSLVKLNLKLLTRAKKLEIDVFKQVARSATHSLLVACGLEYPKPGIHQFSSSICSHEETDIHFRKSTLMPSSCRECFYAFVEDVVNSILLENGNLS